LAHAVNLTYVFQKPGFKFAIFTDHYQSLIYSPTDALESCLKDIKIYIKIYIKNSWFNVNVNVNFNVKFNIVF